MRTLLNTAKAIEARAMRKHWAAYHDGEYVLERQTLFFSRRDLDDCLMSPSKLVYAGAVCKPVKIANNGRQMLVEKYDAKECRFYYAWIHA